MEQAARIALQEGIPFDHPAKLLVSEAFLALLDRHIPHFNEQLARYETIKRYTVIEHEFSMETGELTATLKLKQKVIREKYRDRIEVIYREEASGQAAFRQLVKRESPGR